MNLWRVLVPVIAATLLVGCAANKIASRKQERQAAYAGLPPAQQRLIDEGRIDVGMSTNAVYIAWGSPARGVAGTAPGTFTWIYVCDAIYAARVWKYREVPAALPGGAYYYTVDRDVDFIPTRYECAEVKFENNVVKKWRELPKPEY